MVVGFNNENELMFVCFCVVLVWFGIIGIVILMLVFVVVFLIVVVLLIIMRLVRDIFFLENMCEL